jgi:hypothetical protein
MFLSAFFLALPVFSPPALADVIPSVPMDLLRDTWKIEALSFSRAKREGNRTVDFLDVHFNLYHPKFEECSLLEMSPNGSYRDNNWASAAEFQDPNFCVDWQKSRDVANCNSNGTSTLWRPCSGRRLISPGCSNQVPVIPSSDCPVGEDESERPWVKWRAVNLDEPEYSESKEIRDGWIVDQSRPFRSLAIEIVSGQRLAESIYQR